MEREMSVEAPAARALLLGIGNVLLSDDGIGVHVIRALDELERAGRLGASIALRDGGTLGLELMTELEECAALIVIDAMELGSAPGTIRAFEGADMDAQLGGKHRTAHEVALADLIMAAKLTGCAPHRRALVAIQPGSTGWGLQPTEPVRGAIPDACKAVLSLLEEWGHGTRAH